MPPLWGTQVNIGRVSKAPLAILLTPEPHTDTQRGSFVLLRQSFLLSQSSKANYGGLQRDGVKR